jgi:CBS domain-containing protein
MNIGDIRTPNVVVTSPGKALCDAAQLMRDNNVGALVVLDPREPHRRPIGMLTDRDILRGQLARGADLYCLTVGDVMSRDPLTLTPELSLEEAIEAMNSRAVRRAPVVDGDGALIGIVTLDNLLPAVAGELQELAKLIGTQSRNQRI